MREKLIEIQDLSLSFPSASGDVKVLRGVDIEVRKGEILGLVGESGSGKSMTSLAIMGIVSKPHREIGGKIMFRGRDLLTLPPEDMRLLRGESISMIFQEPMTSLNPVYTVGDQIVEAIRTHRKLSKKEALEEVVELFKKVGIPAPEQRAGSYPHELSGGMRQRVMIAMALSCSPELLIADEPTTALDVTIQAQILDLILKLQKNTGMSVLLITHALGIVAETADRVAVMYAGQVVEQAQTDELFANPKHPYTIGLMNSIPMIPKAGEARGEKRLKAIKGMVPTPGYLPEGCKFSTRCDMAEPRCFKEEPGMVHVSDSHCSRCWLTKGGLRHD